MKEYIEREAATAHPIIVKIGPLEGPVVPVETVNAVPAADVVEVRLLADGTLIVTTDKYPNVTRVFVEDGKTSGSLFYAEEV